MPEAAELRRLQERMQAAITAVDDGPASDVAAEVRGTARLSATERLGLYRRSHVLRLLEVMRVSHPALRHLLGDELFDAFALEYLRERPSRSYTLLRLGEGFVGHLEATREPGDPWAQLVIDVARVERAFAEVYDGPGWEGEDVPDLPAEPPPGVALEPAPCLRLLRTSFPAGSYVRAVRAGEQPDLPAAAPGFLALCRRDYVVTFTELERADYEALEALAAGAPAGREAWPLVRAWARSGFLRAIEERS